MAMSRKQWKTLKQFAFFSGTILLQIKSVYMKS